MLHDIHLSPAGERLGWEKNNNAWPELNLKFTFRLQYSKSGDNLH